MRRISSVGVTATWGVEYRRIFGLFLATTTSARVG